LLCSNRRRLPWRRTPHCAARCLSCSVARDFSCADTTPQALQQLCPTTQAQEESAPHALGVSGCRSGLGGSASTRSCVRTRHGTAPRRAAPLLPPSRMRHLMYDATHFPNCAHVVAVARRARATSRREALAQLEGHRAQLRGRARAQAEMNVFRQRPRPIYMVLCTVCCASVAWGRARACALPCACTADEEVLASPAGRDHAQLCRARAHHTR
jgi:hypothetical protein